MFQSSMSRNFFMSIVGAAVRPLCARGSLGAGAAAACCCCCCCVRVGAWVLVPLLCATVVCVWELGCWCRCCVQMLCARGSLGAGAAAAWCCCVRVGGSSCFDLDSESTSNTTSKHMTQSQTHAHRTTTATTKRTYDRSEVVGLVPTPCGHVSVMNLPRPHYDGRCEMPWTTGRTLHGRRPGRYTSFVLVSIVFPTSTLLLYCLLAIVLIVLAIVHHF